METTRPPDSLERRAAIVAEFATGWKSDLSKVSELLASGWRVHMERAVDDTLQSIERQHGAQLDSLRSDQKRIFERLAQCLRRLRQFENELQWSNVVADAVHLASPRSIVFSINADKLRFQASRGLELSELADIPLAQAAAFQAAVATSEPTVALKTKGEVSDTLAARIGEDPAMRISVYPITTRQRVSAVVYAEDANAALMDAVITAAGATLESHMGRGQSAAANIVTITPAAGTPFITRDEEERHSRAQRFARVQVAEIRLYHSQAVKSGRADSNVYRALKTQLDDVRRVYEEQYLKNAPNMTDYLHQEILRTLANGNSELLGPDYPGPLV